MYTLANISLIVSLIIVVATFGFLFTGLVRRYSVRNALIDHPNERSSHSIPTPRGGGLSISIAVLGSIIVLTLLDWLSRNVAIGMLAGGCLVTTVGWLDDHKDIPAFWRGIFYLLASAVGVFFIGGVSEIRVAEAFSVTTGPAGDILTVLALSWLINLYNFMDGTDGIAAVQAITTSLLAGILFGLSQQQGLSTICFVITGACLGFLFWNWSPARVFMGDVSSCLLGFMFGVLALVGEHTGSVHAPVWFILLSVFIWDATLTLLRRLILRERWYAAHRTHAYQRLTQMGVKHSTLALLVLAINISIFWPLAFLAYKSTYISIYMLILSIVIMAILWSIVQLTYRKRTSNLSGESH